MSRGSASQNEEKTYVGRELLDYFLHHETNICHFLVEKENPEIKSTQIVSAITLSSSMQFHLYFICGCKRRTGE